MSAPVIGLVGVGNWGRHILRDLRQLGALVHVAANHETSVRNAVDGGAASIVADATELPAACQGFVVANRTVEHLGAVDRLCVRERPIFVEKPLSADPIAAERLRARAGHLVYVMHKWRYHPGILALADIVKSAEFGPLLGVRTFRLSGPVRHSDVSPTWILLPHDISIMLEMLGEVPVPVSCIPDPLTHDGHGLIARLSARGGTVNIVVEVSTGHVHQSRGVILGFRDAVCQLRDDRYDVVTVQPRESSAPPVERSVGREMPLYEELRAFLAFLDGGPPPKTSFDEELRVLNVIAALRA